MATLDEHKLALSSVTDEQLRAVVSWQIDHPMSMIMFGFGGEILVIDSVAGISKRFQSYMELVKWAIKEL